MNKHNESKSGFKDLFVSGETSSAVSSESLQTPVSSEDRGEVTAGESIDPLQTPVSSEEGGEFTGHETATKDQVVNSFNGGQNIGELESLPNFDPRRALREGVTKISLDKLQKIPEMRPKGIIKETVCEEDDRVQVMNTTTVPWRWICKLIMKFPDGARFVGTGWFIGPKAVMTAGHCVFSKENGGWASEILVIPGMQGGTQPFGSMTATSFRSVTGWTKNEAENYDYGCIILPSPTLGNEVGYFGFAALSDESLQDLLTNNSGYPGDKPAGTQWFNAGRVTGTSAQKISYMLDTFGGQSGSPTWRSQNGQYHAIGIHAYGGCPNSSTRINTDVHNNMMTWRES